MERKRGFEIAKGWEDKGINLPVRKTKHAAGYDIEAAEDTVIPAFKPGQKPTLVKTGLKAYCEPDEFYMLCNRSSNPGKRGLVLANSVGIIDCDYYENEDNDGHFMFAFYNFFDHDVEIKKGDAIGQAIFMKYLTVDNDASTGERKGGFGSTDKN
jgi:dUTP pyrophosphatase